MKEAPESLLIHGREWYEEQRIRLHLGTRIREMMRAGRAALLCPSMSDFSSGRYLNQIAEAVVELSRERGTKHFVLTFGCQWVILSTDGDLLAERLKRDYDIDLVLWEDSHLEFGDHE